MALDKQEVEENNFTERVRKNPWMISTVVLGIIALILVVLVMPNSTLTGNAISEKDASSKIMAYVNSVASAPVTFVASKDLGNFYEVQVLYQNQTLPLYISKDGKYWTSVLQAMTPAQTQTAAETTEVPKTAKPVAEAFVFAYCPYGLQFEKALLPVYKLLKNQADIKLVFIGAMHGPHEEAESLRQICIEKVYGKDKLFDYLDKFMGDTKIGDCNDNQTCSAPLINAIFAQLSIDKSKIESCMSTDAQAIYEQNQARAQQLGVQGSPTFVVNGVQVSVGRSPSSVKDAICSAFSQIPSECSQTVAQTSSTNSGASCG